jgi:hypothetical protein
MYKISGIKFFLQYNGTIAFLFAIFFMINYGIEGVKMKKSIFFMNGLLFIVLLATPAIAAKKASVDWGEELYKSPTLGGSTNEKSCSSCHETGDKRMLKKVMEMSRKELSIMLNKCITGPLQGKELDPKSEKMRSLRLYLNFLTDDCL